MPECFAAFESRSEFLSRELDKAVGGSQHKLMFRQIQALAVCKIGFWESSPGAGLKTHSKSGVLRPRMVRKLDPFELAGSSARSPRLATMS
jgi:hypothetical protein